MATVHRIDRQLAQARITRGDRVRYWGHAGPYRGRFAEVIAVCVCPPCDESLVRRFTVKFDEDGQLIGHVRGASLEVVSR